MEHINERKSESEDDIMKKVYTLAGLECANCAAKMEKAIASLDGVNYATVNFLTTRLIIDGEEDKLNTIIKAVKKIVKKIEPDVEIKIV